MKKAVSKHFAEHPSWDFCDCESGALVEDSSERSIWVGFGPDRSRFDCSSAQRVRENIFSVCVLRRCAHSEFSLRALLFYIFIEPFCISVARRRRRNKKWIRDTHTLTSLVHDKWLYTPTAKRARIFLLLFSFLLGNTQKSKSSAPRAHRKLSLSHSFPAQTAQ